MELFFLQAYLRYVWMGSDSAAGGTFDYFGELSHPDYKGITDEQYPDTYFTFPINSESVKK